MAFWALETIRKSHSSRDGRLIYLGSLGAELPVYPYSHVSLFAAKLYFNYCGMLSKRLRYERKAQEDAGTGTTFLAQPKVK